MNKTDVDKLWKKYSMNLGNNWQNAITKEDFTKALAEAEQMLEIKRRVKQTMILKDCDMKEIGK